MKLTRKSIPKFPIHTLPIDFSDQLRIHLAGKPSIFDRPVNFRFAIHRTAAAGETGDLLKLLDLHPQPIRSQIALIWAAANNHSETVTALFKRGAVPTARAIRAAHCNRQDGMVKMLLARTAYTALSDLGIEI